MRKTLALPAVWWSAAALLCAAPGVCRAAEAAQTPRRGEAVAVMVEEGPAIDGTMNDPLWAKCPPWPMGACTSDDPQKYKTWVKVLFDPTHIYVGVYCEEPDTAGLAANVAPRDGPVWNDDSVEVFLRPAPGQPVCQFVVNPRGTIYDARDKEPTWNSTAKVKAAIQEGKSWTVTLAIPMKELPTHVGDNQAWTVNVYRTRPARGGDQALMYSWSIMGEADYHATSEFGVLTGIDIPKRADGVTRVREGGVPRPMVRNRGVEAGGVIIYRKIDFDQGADAWELGEGAKGGPSGDAAHGRALRVDCEKGWAGCELPVSIAGSRGLKVACLMKGRNLESAGINVYDTVARDNTTAYGYRYLRSDRFTPILYFLDGFRYNSRTEGFVSPATHYSSVRFYGPSRIRPGTWFALDNFVIYRGDDHQPPGKVSGLAAKATGRGVELTWQPAEDNVAAAVYVISRSGDGPFEKIAETCTTSYLDATAGRATYRYRVFAVDFEENYGPWSDAVSVRSTSTPREPALSREEEDRLVYAAHVRQVHGRGVGKVRKNHATLFGDSLTGATVYPQCARAAFGTLTVGAFGYPAMRTSFARNKVHEILRQDNPEFMFILYGTNNNKAEEHIPAAMDDLASVVATCEANGTVAVLGTIPPRGWAPESAPEASFNRHVIERCGKLKIPIGYVFEGFQEAGPQNRRTYMGGDGVHWTGEGMAIGARAWGRALEQIRFGLRDQK
jgi:hypothetical protein